MSSTDVHDFINAVENLIRSFGLFWRNNIGGLHIGPRNIGNIRGALLLAYTYARIIEHINNNNVIGNITYNNVTNNEFRIELYVRRPYGSYNSSYVTFNVGKRRVSAVANIYANKILNLNLDVALIENIIPHTNTVRWNRIIFFGECKYYTIYSQTYATAVGQRYIVKAASNWRGIKDAIITAEGVSESIQRANASTYRIYDPQIITYMRPSGNGHIILDRILQRTILALV